GRLIPYYGMSLIQETRHYQIIHSWREEHSVALQRFDRRHEIASCVRFEHKSARAGIEGFADDLIGIGDRQDNDFEMRVMLQQLTRGVKAVEMGHANIQDHHVRLQLLGHFDSFAAVGCFSAHFPSLMPLKKRTQTTTYNLVIIG